MVDRFLGLLITLFHALWVVFMLSGFFWAIAAFFIHRRFFDLFWFRTLHLLGILLASLFPLLGEYCPLTIWENFFHQKTGAAYEGGFILRYLEKFIYPDIDPVLIRIGTFIVAFVSIAVYILRPPKRTKLWFKRKLGYPESASGGLKTSATFQG